MSAPVALAFRVAADLQAMKANLKEAVDQVETTASSMKRMANSLDGSKIIADAGAIVKTVSDIGGAAKLTEAEQARVNATLTQAIDKYAALGKQAPQAMLDLAAATKQADEHSESFFSHLVAGVASGELLAHGLEKVGEVALDAFKEAAMALPELIEHTIQTGNQIYEMSLKTGASVENLSKLRYVASQTGIDFQSFGDSMFKMEKFLGSTGEAAVKAQATLDRLGLSLQTLKNEKPDEAFIDVISALEKIPNRAEQASIGAAIFSKGFKDMAGLAQEDIHELMEEAEKLGLVMSTNTAAAAHAAEIGFKSLEMQMESVGLRIGAAFLPAIIGLQQNIGEVLKGSIDGTNKSLDQMGGGSGFLATVARAMGTGNAAIAAQVTLYETLRDALIAFVRGGIEPTITAFGFFMVEWNALKVVLGDVAQVIDGVALAFEYLSLGMAKSLNIASFGKAFGDDVKRIQNNIDDLLGRMTERAAALKEDKKNEQDWAAGSVSANAKIETAVKALGSTHTDVAGIIEKFAATSRNAYGGAAEGAETADKSAKGFEQSLKKVTDTIDAAVRHHVSLTDQVRLYGAEALKAADEASTWGKTVDSNVMAVAVAFEVSKIKIDATGEAFKQAFDKFADGVRVAIPEAIKLQGVINELVKVKDGLPSEIGTKVTIDTDKLGKSLFNGADWKAVTENSSAALAEIAKKAHDTYAYMADNSQSFSDATIRHFKKIADEAQHAADGTKSAWDRAYSAFGDVATILDNLPGKFAQIGAVAARTGQAIMKNLADGNVWGAVVAGATGALQVFTKLFSSAGRDAVKQFADSMGGFDALHQKLLDSLHGVGEEFWVRLTQEVGRGDAKGAQAVIQEIQNALASAPLNAAELAAQAGYKTQADLQAVADKAKEVYDYMVSSGQYSASQIAGAFKAMQDAQLAAMDDTKRAAYDAATTARDAAQKVIDGLNGQIKSLQDSINQEAPEEVMGSIEAQQRAQLASLEAQRQAAQANLDEANNKIADAAQAAVDAASAAAMKAGELTVTGIQDALDRNRFRVHVDVDVDGLPGGGSLPQHGTGGFFDRPHAAIIGDKPEYITPRSSIGDLAQEIAAAMGGGSRGGGNDRALAQITKMLRDQPRAMALAVQNAMALSAGRR
jgi:hypothetical protein